MVDKEFITAKYTKKESDLVYKITQKENTVYFLLLEIQSKPDRKMAYRILNYEMEIWRKLENNRKKGEKFSLIPIIPCVIYNGKRSWNSPVEIQELYNKNEFPGEYLLKQKYILIDIVRYNPGDLLNLGSLISAVFYLDSSKAEELDKRLEKLLKSMVNMSREEKMQLKKWAVNMLLLSNESLEKVEGIVEEEDFEMGGIRSELLRWYNEGKRESRLSGIRQKSIQLLLMILPKKLEVELPEDVIAGIENAPSEVLTELENNIFSFNSVDDVVRVLEG